MLAKSVSQCSIKFQRKVTDGVVFKKTWRNNISFKKENEKSVITNESLDTNYCKVQDCKIFVHVSIISNTNILLEGHTLNIVRQILCSSTYSRNGQIESLYFPEGK